MNAIELESPLGKLTLVEDEGVLVGLHFGTHPAEKKRTPLLERAAAQLGEYFEGRREAFDLPLQPRGTAFQRAVWAALAAIPFGQTVSYAHIARKIGRPKAVRAVGAANGANPIALIIPCHRVIGAGGALTGYGGGLPRKQWLLQHEDRQRTLTV